MTTTQENNLSRRDFLKLGVGALSALAVLEMGGVSLFFMQPRSLVGEFGGIVNAGPVDSFPAGSVVEFPDGRFFLIHAPDGGFLAVYSRCTHLGCTISWEADKNHFFCPCHASSFDTIGDVQNPPAPRVLDLFDITVEEGQVLVNTGSISQRDRFTTDQLTYA